MTALDRIQRKDRITREELEAATAEQEKEILRLRAELAEERTRSAKLQRMHDHAQRHIERLQRALDKAKTSEAERVFRK